MQKRCQQTLNLNKNVPLEVGSGPLVLVSKMMIHVSVAKGETKAVMRHVAKGTWKRISMA
jgi:hypothetical protein